MNITVPYYEDMSRYSNSDIGWFLKYGPTYLHDMKTGKEKGIEASYLDRGTMIHMSILQKDEFKKSYKVKEVTKPQSKQQKLFADELKASTEVIHEKALMKAYRDAYTSRTNSDDMILIKAKELENKLQDYIDDSKDTRTSISFADKSLIDKLHLSLKNHKLASYLLNDKNYDEVHNEFHINWEFPKEYEGIHLPCKSLIDRCMFNWEKKEVVLIDLKTTVNINNFAHSINTYDYCRQLAYYWTAILWYLKNEKQLDIQEDEWSFKTYIIALSTSDNNGTVRVFNITEAQLNDRLDTINDAIAKIAWHYKNNKWDYSKEYYTGDGSELITL